MKRKYFSKPLVMIVLMLSLFSCKKHSYFQNNPNSPSTALPSLLLTNICISVFDFYPATPAYAARHLTYYEGGNSAVDYSWTSYDWASYDLKNYDILRQVMDMDRL